MKKIFYMFLTMFLLSGFLLPLNVAQAGNPYDYEVVDMSPGAILSHGESVILWVKIRNTGTVEWKGHHPDHQSEGFVHLGTSQHHDRMSDFYKEGNWIKHNRVHMMDEYEVAPGNVGSFGFYITVPDYLPAGNYRECFAPVVEGVTWMADKGICWDINVFGEVTKEIYAAEMVSGDVDLEYLSYEAEREVELVVKNVGTATWYQGGDFPVHLGTVNSLDHEGQLYHDSWLTMNRAAGLQHDEVEPGELGIFRFTVKVPSGDSRSFSDDFWLVSEGKTWFDGANSDYAPKYFSVRVEATAGDDKFSYLEVDNDSPMVGEEVTVTVVLKDSDEQPIADREVVLYGGGCYTEGVGCAYIDEEVVVTDENGVAYYTNSFDEPAEITIWYRVDDWYTADEVNIEYRREGQSDWSGDYAKVIYLDRQQGFTRAEDQDLFDDLDNWTRARIAEMRAGYGRFWQLDREMLDIMSRYDWYELNYLEPTEIVYTYYDGWSDVEESVMVDRVLVVNVGDDVGYVFYYLNDIDAYVSLDEVDLSGVDEVLEPVFD